VKTAILYCYGSGSPSPNVLLLLQYEQRRPYAWTSPKAKQPLGAWWTDCHALQCDLSLRPEPAA
jgi:hypothetical protein